MDSIHKDIKISEKVLKGIECSRRFFEFWRKKSQNKEDIWGKGADDGVTGEKLAICSFHSLM